MKYEETDVIELKRNLNDTFEKEIVAFLNTNGGTIYIGVNDDGSIYGVDNLDKTMKNIADIITDKILPNAQHLITPIAKLEEGKMIIEISVKKGDSLYYIKKYGRSASGCFIRIGTTVRGMSEDQIDKALIKSLHIQKPKIIDIESTRQDLTFEQFKYLLTFNGVHINKAAFYHNFHLKNKDNKFNKIAFLLSDQNDISIKVVRFRGTDKSEFISRKEFGFCCIIKAMNDALEYSLNVLNIIQTNIVGATRVDTPYFDEDSFREAWINAIAHHDWTQDTPPAIYGFDDRVEIISHGKLKEDLTEDEFFKGVSKPVNEELAKIFIQMHYIEQSGKGVPTIVRNYGKKVFHFGSSFIECVLPYNILDKAKTDELNGKTTQKTAQKTTQKIDKVSKKVSETIIDEINKNSNITRKELAVIIGISDSGIKYQLNKLKSEGKIKRVGPVNGGHWEVTDK